MILTEARRWLGTPYHHQASFVGIGTDCIGLVRGVYRGLYDRDCAPLPPYSRDWAEATGHEHLIAGAGAYLTAIATTDARPGDVLVFRYRASSVAKHAAILARRQPPQTARDKATTTASADTSTLTLIHAMEGRAVAEVPFSPWWHRHVAAAFAFPGIID